MASRLPKWVEYGAFTLALLAGTVNVVGLLGFQHQAVSHLSGTLTLLGTAFASSNESILHLIAILLSFLLGSTITGYFLSNPTLKLGRHYDSLLIIEGLLLFLAIYFLNRHLSLGHYLASAACGLQNALATTYSGAIIRTTHVTGIFTDLGIMIGASFRGKKFEKRKAFLFVLIILGFLIGGIIGSLLYQSFTFYALFFPASICFILAAAYRTYSVKNFS